MNIFILHRIPRLAARYHCDKHVTKMITESCQMISTCLIVKHKIKSNKLYKACYVNNKLNIWLRKSDGNLNWLIQLTKGLIDEYNLRFKKEENYVNAKAILNFVESLTYLKLDEPMTDFVLAMPDEYKNIDPVESYRTFYLLDKRVKGKVQYNHSPKPKWYSEMETSLK